MSFMYWYTTHTVQRRQCYFAVASPLFFYSLASIVNTRSKDYQGGRSLQRSATSSFTSLTCAARSQPIFEWFDSAQLPGRALPFRYLFHSGSRNDIGAEIKNGEGACNHEPEHFICKKPAWADAKMYMSISQNQKGYANSLTDVQIRKQWN